MKKLVFLFVMFAAQSAFGFGWYSSSPSGYITGSSFASYQNLNVGLVSDSDSIYPAMKTDYLLHTDFASSYIEDDTLGTGEASGDAGIEFKLTEDPSTGSVCVYATTSLQCDALNIDVPVIGSSYMESYNRGIASTSQTLAFDSTGTYVHHFQGTFKLVMPLTNDLDMSGSNIYIKADNNNWARATWSEVDKVWTLEVQANDSDGTTKALQEYTPSGQSVGGGAVSHTVDFYTTDYVAQVRAYVYVKGKLYINDSEASRTESDTISDARGTVTYVNSSEVVVP